MTQSFINWNVNGIRSIIKKDFLQDVREMNPDVFCMQETKGGYDEVMQTLSVLDGYHVYVNSSKARKGYSGTAILTRQPPTAVRYGLGIPEFDDEGRTIIADYPDFTLINCYFPNGGSDNGRVPFKLAFCETFLEVCQQLRGAGRAVIFCGDVNTAHQEIDLARPRENRNATGFLREERDWIDRVVAHGYVDTLRHLHPNQPGLYTWWAQFAGARTRNVGWRLDYFFVTPELLPRVRDAFILPEVMGSDHCPVGLGVGVRSTE